MLNKNLKVKIPKKFKKQLIVRFSASNAEIGKDKYSENRYEINSPCPLCNAYGGVYTCIGCPFSKFGTTKISGCVLWFREILNKKFRTNIVFETELVYWSLSKDKQARKLLKKLKTQAKKYIEWV